MNLKRKIIGITLCILMLTTIPMVAGMTQEKAVNEPEPTDIGRTVVRGFYFNMRPNGFGYRFFALRVHYTEVTGTTRTTGVVTMKPVTVGKQANIGFNYAGPAGMFGYMAFSTFKGGIEL
jgi:hypothetical protein